MRVEASATPQVEASTRHTKFNNFLASVICGSRQLMTSKNGEIFLDAICAQTDPPTCIEKIISSPVGLSSVQTSLRLDLSPAFIDGPASRFLQYISHSSLKTICGGEFLRQIVLHVAQPPIFWNALVQCVRDGKLGLHAQECFGWLLSELLCLDEEKRTAYVDTARDRAISRVFSESQSSDVRRAGERVRHILDTIDTVSYPEAQYGAGGRHDNDFADFRQVSILPTADELTSEELPFLRVADALDDLDQISQRQAAHVDNQFRLLRDDMLTEMREELHIMLGKKTGRRKGFVFEDFKVVGVNCGTADRRESWKLQLQFESDLSQLAKVAPKDRKRFFEDKKDYFKHESLICLLVDGQTVAFPVIHRNVDLLACKPPIVTLELTDQRSTSKALLKLKTGKKFKLMQIRTGIFAYEPILKGLQGLTDFPLADDILHWTSGKALGLALQPPIKVITKLEANLDYDLQTLLSTPKSVRLDHSQALSLLSGLKQTVSLIQGPPGTGKSFIGALIAKSLYQHTKKTILVVCYTNHALDQFLEDLLGIGIPKDAMVRLGSKSTAQTKSLLLGNQTASYRRSADGAKIMNNLKKSVEDLAGRMQTVFSNYQSGGGGKAALLEYLEFSDEDDLYFEAFTVSMDPNGMTKIGKKGKAIDRFYLLDRWTAGADAGVLHGAVTPIVRHVWAMDKQQRHTKLSFWNSEMLKEQITEFCTAAKTYKESYDKLRRMFGAGKEDIIRSKRIVGCTTTAAAMYKEQLQAVSRDVLLVEEAGEILESHIITALGPSTQQLILIGDHKQLRPKIKNHRLSVEKGDGYDLNRSLFERLVLKGYPHQTLMQQHRMRPEISSLIRTLTYPGLVDAPKTRGRPDLRGFRDNIIFINHSHPEVDQSHEAISEDFATSSSRRNDFEAAMVVKTVRYLAQQGYGTEKVVVLTAYLAQLHLLRDSLSKTNDPILNDVDSFDLVRAGLMPAASAKLAKRSIYLSTIDNYQGEEKDIVIVSLTRSNQSHNIGFLSQPERLNVLLSRARNALILIGNTETFYNARKGNTVWAKLFDQLKIDGHIYDGLPVKCERHPDRIASLREPSDFDHECPDGGCKEPWKCEKDAEEEERRKRKALEFKEKREKAEREYEEKLLKINEEIEARTQDVREKRLAEERQMTLQQKRKDLEGIVDPPPIQIPSQTQLTNTKKPNTPDRALEKKPIRVADSKAPPSLQNSYRPTASQSKVEWERQKSLEKASNIAIDSLMDMVGLESVKSQVLGIKAKIDLSLRQGTDVKDERFNVSLLGNPGTGKTTVARLYAKVLTSLGVLPGDAFVETTGSRLTNDGVAGVKKHLEQIHNAGGGAFFVDEAYQLTSPQSYGGPQVLDFLLAEMENNVGKIVFIIAGYDREMEKFFEHNDGLSSRVPYKLHFADYEDNELLYMLANLFNKKYKGRMNIEDGEVGLYMRIAIRRLGRGRGRPGFGNARALQTMMAQIFERQARRLNAERKEGQLPDDFYLTKDDLVGPDPSLAIRKSTAWEKLQKMTGLRSVKESIRAMIDRINVNYKREMEEKNPIEISLNRCFIGSPGTGKTTVAKLYGQILVDLGLLSNGEVVTKNPADFVGSVLGQSESNTKAILASTVGKVLIIDEAYMLYSGANGAGTQSDPYKTAVIDTIVAEVQSVPGEDRCVLLLGYKEQIVEMFRNVNPGLSRRFAIEASFHFEDFNDQELLEILDMKLRQQDLDATDEAKKVALEVLSRARNRPNFGNAGEVENQLSLAKGRFQSRQSSQKDTGGSCDVVFAPQDFDADYMRGARAATNLQSLFEGMIGCEDVIAKLGNYQKLAQGLKARGQDPRETVPTNFLFKGPPGTGKTTTARKMGQVFYDMGFLSDVEVIDCSASDLIAQFVGGTGPKTKAQLEKALGKVLFIDEAYRLAEGHFATEAMNELVDQLTKPQFKGKLIVVLAGYDQDINSLIAVNPGLTSRFPEEIVFQNMNTDDMLNLLQQELGKKQIEGPSLTNGRNPQHKELVNVLKQLASLPSWGNARDIQTIAKTLTGLAFTSNPDPTTALKISFQEILECAQQMLTARLQRQNNQAVPKVPGPWQSELQTNLAPAPLNKAPPVTAAKADAVEARVPRNVEQPPTTDPSPEAVRDDGVSDAVWQQLQLDKQAAERHAEAQKAQIANQEEALRVAEEKEKQATQEYITRSRIKTETEKQKRKLERARLREQNARVAREKARLEMERLQVAEREEKRVQQKLRRIGKCVAGFDWIKQGGGYRCSAGGHFVSDADLAR